MRKCFSTFFAISFLVLALNFDLTSQQSEPLLFKSGNRVLESNIEDWVRSFDIQKELLFDDRFYKVVQFSDIPKNKIHELLKSAGVNLLSYVPVNGYIASFSADFDTAALKMADIFAVTDLLIEERVAPILHNNIIPDHAVRDNNRVELVVTLFKDVNSGKAANKLRGKEWELLRISGLGRYLHIVIPIEDISSLVSYPFVQFIEPCDPPAEPDNFRGRSLHRATTSFSYAAGVNDYDGRDVTVLLNDDGFVGPHIDFKGRIPYQFTLITGADHGDHCAGTILGAGNLDPLAMGMAPAAELIVYSASGYPGFDSIYNQYNTKDIRITSTSYSNGCNAGYTNLAAKMDDQIYNMPELMHIFSAGNSGTQNCGYGAGPGWGNITGGHKIGKNVIAVANVNYKDEIATSSSRGPAHDGRLKPDISALGTQVYSTSEDNEYVIKSGTSMACPGVAGSIATLYDAFQRHHGTIPNGGLIKSIMMNSADDLGNPGPDFTFGYGRINTRRAAKIIKDSLWISGNINHNDSLTFQITVPNHTKDLRVMLYWTDVEGTVNTTRALVNDLDLYVISPDSIWLPWVLDHTPLATLLDSPAERKKDTLNNAEQVTLSDPLPGNYTIAVKGSSVPFGPQKFFVNYYFSDHEFVITYPQAKDALVPNETTVVRWDAFHDDINTFLLEYSPDNGNQWLVIDSAIASSNRYYDWIVPQITSGEVLLSLTRDTCIYTTEQFTLIDVPQNLLINWVCMDSVSLSWEPVAGAIEYRIFMLGHNYMDSITSTTDTTVVLYGIPHYSEEWFAVSAIGQNDAFGRRGIAVEKIPGIMNCVYEYDLALNEIVYPGPLILSSCHDNLPRYITINIKNEGLTDAVNFDLSYQVNNDTVITETYTGSLSPGNITNYTFNTPVNFPVHGDYLITIWTDLKTDLFPYNDTMQQIVSVVNFPVLQVPFLETFETFPFCISTNGCEKDVCTLINGWLNPENETFDNTDWITNRGTTPSFFTGPSTDRTTGTTFGRYLYVEASYCFESTAELISPCIDLSNTSLPVLSFWYHMFGAHMGQLHIDILSDGLWYLDIVSPISGNQGNNWLEKRVPLDGFAGKIINVRFRALTGSNYMSDIALDDIGVFETIGLYDHKPVRSFLLKPNPAKSYVELSGTLPDNSPVQIIIFNQHGQQMFAKELSVSDNNTQFNETIPLDGFSSGVYFVQCISNRGTIIERLIVTGNR